MFDVSGVVAVVSSALTAGAIARVRLSPDNWRYLERVWEQTGFWASSLVFVSASMLVPRLLTGVTLQDFWLLVIALAAAFVSRAAVLFGLLPLLSALRLSQRVSGAYKLVITWGGLRGALTLALALAVTENTRIDPTMRDFVAVLATGFVLFTLLVNGLTLRPVIRLLQLDRLSPLNQALRNKVLALSLADVRDVVSKVAQEYEIATTAAEAAAAPLDRRVDELASQPDLEQAISDRDRIRIGLVAIANRERRIILDHHAQRTVSGAAIERLLRNTNLILDAARAEGLVGYNRAARALLGFPRAFRVANFLHRRLNLARPLQREISIRFETLLIRRLALEELARFVESRLHALLGERVADRARGTHLLAAELSILLGGWGCDGSSPARVGATQRGSPGTPNDAIKSPGSRCPACLTGVRWQRLADGRNRPVKRSSRNLRDAPKANRGRKRNRPARLECPACIV